MNKEEINSRLSNQLKHARIEYNLTYQKIALNLGATEESVENFEKFPLFHSGADFQKFVRGWPKSVTVFSIQAIIDVQKLATTQLNPQ